MRALALAVVLAAAGLLTACASTAGDQPATSVAPTGHGTFAHCLSEHGVPAAPGPVMGPPPGVDQNTWHRAMQTCSSLAPGPAD